MPSGKVVNSSSLAIMYRFSGDTLASVKSAPEKSTKRDILKEQVPVPRKLVRGQDVWLGKGEEQTKHILKKT